jgi:translation elongation factor EF-Tu-like GTPase
MVMPGDTVELTCELISTIAMEKTWDLLLEKVEEQLVLELFLV